MLPCVSAIDLISRPEGVCHICLTLLLLFFSIKHFMCNGANFQIELQEYTVYIYLYIYINCFRQSTRLHCIMIIAKKKHLQLNFPPSAPQKLVFLPPELSLKMGKKKSDYLQFDLISEATVSLKGVL